MAKKRYFLASTEAGKAIQFAQFRDNIGAYAALFGITPAEVTAQAADANYYQAMLPLAATMDSAGPQWTEWKRTFLTGTSGTQPALPTLPADYPAAVPPAGAQTRFLDLAGRIKDHSAYTVSIGEILGIEGSERSGPDYDTIQPEIKAKLSAGQVMVLWGWLGYSGFLSMCEIQVDRGDGKGFVFLSWDGSPDYLDTTPWPAALTKWSYRARYRVGDHPVGNWSLAVSVTVGG